MIFVHLIKFYSILQVVCWFVILLSGERLPTRHKDWAVKLCSAMLISRSSGIGIHYNRVSGIQYIPRICVVGWCAIN